MSITNDDINSDWELSDAITISMEGDGDGTDPTDGDDSDGDDGDSDGDGTDGTDGDGSDA